MRTSLRGAGTRANVEAAARRFGKRRNAIPRVVPGAVIVLGLVFLAACSSGGEPSRASTGGSRSAAPVTVATAQRMDVPVQLHAIGNVEPYSTVSVRSQVEGQLAEVHFREGQEVQEDDLLFTVDPRPFEAALRQSEANLARDRAQLDNAQVEEGREARLVKQGIVSQNEYDQAKTQVQTLAASVRADEAAVENAKLRLQYAYIRSPITGRIGAILVNQGNVVKSNDTVLATINQLRPVYVSFSVPEGNLAEIRRRQAAGSVPVEAEPPDGDPAAVPGKLAFVNNTVDMNTGTVLLKGIFPNQDEHLWPGAFVNVRMTLSIESGVVVVPEQALETGQKGTYVYVVQPDLTVQVRPVKTGLSFGSDVVVEEGLQAGERVVTEGQIRLAPGSVVEIKNAATAGTSTPPGGAS